MSDSDKERLLRAASLNVGNQPAQPIGQANVGLYREPTQQITFVYKNWKGEIRERRVIPLNIEFGHDHYHHPDQWLLHAIDMDKGARRTFAFEDILSPIRRA